MKYFLFALGCKVNSYEMSSLAYLLKQKGHIEDKENPDVVVINTCSVTSTADQKSRQHIRKFQKQFPNALIVVMGCYSQKAHAFIFNDIKADIVTGTSNRTEILKLIESSVKIKERKDITEEQPRYFSYEEMGLASYSENIRAYLKIQDGCDNFCSYCLIPYVRGKSRSRDLDSIIKEANYLVNNGYKEIVLTGIHVGGYGKDIDGFSFSDLIEKLVEIPDLFRLRISSIEETEIDDKLINLINSNDKLAKHLHIPLQSGSDTVLKRMNRKYSAEQFVKRLNYIKSLIPNVALTTDVIVGFPGETDEEFNETIQTIKQSKFDMLHVFPFSSREGTAASKMSNQIDSAIKKSRAAKLIELSKELWNNYCLSQVDTKQQLLIEKNENGFAIGHTGNYMELKIEKNSAKAGDIIEIEIKKDMIIS